LAVRIRRSGFGGQEFGFEVQGIWFMCWKLGFEFKGLGGAILKDKVLGSGLVV
jgi:hypothetical protein